MKQLYTFLFLMVAGLSFGQNIVISQYIETSSGTTPKGIELWNPTGSDIDFSTSDLQIFIGTNGGALGSILTLNSGTLPAGAVLVVGTSDMDLSFLTGECTNTTFQLEPFTFNGDDALQVQLGGVVQDTFGNPGNDPGSAWTGGGVSTRNSNISILSGITTGDTDGWTDPSTRFENTAGGTDLTGFGIPPTGCPTSDPIVQFVSATSTLAEDGLFVEIDLLITNENATDTTVEIDLDGASTATNGTDYDDGASSAISFPVTITFPGSSSMNQTFEIFISNDDAVEEMDETVILNLQNPTNNATIGTTGTHTLTITDNDGPQVCFDLSTGSDQFVPVSVTDNSDMDRWEFNSGEYTMNGFCGGGCMQQVEQWLIFGSLDLASTTNLSLAFDAVEAFGDTDLAVVYSTSYAGDPSDAGNNWQNVGSVTDTGSESIDFSAAAGNSDVTIGIQYIDDGTDGYSGWSLSNVELGSTDASCPVVGCSIFNLQATATCNGDDAELTVSFDVIGGSGAYEVSLDEGITYIPITMPEGETFTLPGPTTATENVILEVRDATLTGCSEIIEYDIPECPAPPIAQFLRINEFHYDNDGTDVNEFVEIFYVSSVPLTSPADYEIILVNGSNGDAYDRISLDDMAITSTSDSFGQYYVWEPASIQNGGPDGIALCGPSGLIQFWSYEGTFMGSQTGECFDGVMSTEIADAGNTPVSEIGDESSPANAALQFQPDVFDDENPGPGPLSDGGVAGYWGLFTESKGGFNTLTPLPITLEFFEGELTNQDQVELSWRTAAEINNDYFEIYRSTDHGNTWQTIGTKDGAGNSNVSVDYSFTDTAPVAGANFYRLKQVDFDGTETFEGDIVQVNVNSELKVVSFSRNQAVISFPKDGNAIVNVYDMRGMMVEEVEFAATEGLQNITLSQLPVGVYVIRVVQDGNASTSKYVVAP